MTEAEWINETLQWAALALGVLVALLELPRYREVRNRPRPASPPSEGLASRVRRLEQELIHGAKIDARLEERIACLEEVAGREAVRAIPPVARPPVPRRGKPEGS